MPDKKAAANELFEVMTDTWGAEPQFVKGDLIHRGDAPNYDFDWAETMGSLRKAPEYQGREIASTTEPITTSGAVDDDEQRHEAIAAGDEPHEPRPGVRHSDSEPPQQPAQPQQQPQVKK